MSVELCTNGEVTLRPSGRTCTPFESSFAIVTMRSFIDSAHILSIESESFVLSFTLGLGVFGIVDETLVIGVPELMTITFGGPCFILGSAGAGGLLRLILKDELFMEFRPKELPPFMNCVWAIPPLLKEVFTIPMVPWFEGP